jgi:hypothetical protein
MTTSGPEVFTLDAEELAHKAEGWDPAAHSPRETINLISELTRLLMSERAGRATRAELIKHSNIAYGTLEAEHRECKRALEVMSRHAEALEIELSTARECLALSEASAGRLIAERVRRGWLSRLAARIEDWLQDGRTTRLGP